MATNRLSIGKVFVPGGMPEITYVPRTERHLKTTLAEVEDNLCKLVVVTGATKTGKTVLVRKVLDTGRKIVWIDGGLVTTETEFWHECLRAMNLDIILETENGSVDSKGSKVGGNASAKVFGMGVSGAGELNDSRSIATRTKMTPSGTIGRKALDAMTSAKAILGSGLI